MSECHPCSNLNVFSLVFFRLLAIELPAFFLPQHQFYGRGVQRCPSQTTLPFFICFLMHSVTIAVAFLLAHCFSFHRKLKQSVACIWTCVRINSTGSNCHGCISQAEVRFHCDFRVFSWGSVQHLWVTTKPTDSRLLAYKRYCEITTTTPTTGSLL